MAEINTIARPYAKAAFRTALEGNSLTNWLNMLSALAQVTYDESVQTLLNDPKITEAQLGQFFKEVLVKVLDEQGQNFVDILVEKSRLSALPAIFSLYNKMYEEQQKTVTATVTVASPLNEQQLSSLKQALEKRLAHDVEIDTVVDPEVYGGVRVQANDLVIDGTIKGRLQRLFENLNATR